MSLIAELPISHHVSRLPATLLLAASILFCHAAEGSAESAVSVSAAGSAVPSSGIAQLIVDWRECFTRNVIKAEATSIIAACDRASAFPDLSAKEREKLSRQRLRVQEGLQQRPKGNATAEQR